MSTYLLFTNSKINLSIAIDLKTRCSMTSVDQTKDFCDQQKLKDSYDCSSQKLCRKNK